MIYKYFVYLLLLSCNLLYDINCIYYNIYPLHLRNTINCNYNKYVNNTIKRNFIKELDKLIINDINNINDNNDNNDIDDIKKNLLFAENHKFLYDLDKLIINDIINITSNKKYHRLQRTIEKN